MRILIAAALLASSATTAAAQCAPADLAGSWSLIGSNGGAFSDCQLTTDVDGLSEGRCQGTGRSRRGDPIEVEMNLRPNCRFTGQWTIDGIEQDLQGALVEGNVGMGVGIVRFGPRKRFGLHFTLVRTGQ
jgi:hypothetical protein